MKSVVRDQSLALLLLSAVVLVATPVAAGLHSLPQEEDEGSTPESVDQPPGEETEVESEDDCKKSDDDCTLHDCRSDFEASLFIGSVIDNFAAQELQDYLNPDASGQTDVFERMIGGVDFAYRMLGDPADTGKWAQQVWVWGWTVHGVRSADVDCKASPSLFVCQDQLNRPDIDDFDDQFLFVLRNATSLEAAVGLRWEFRSLEGSSNNNGTSARLYLSAQAGFLTVSGDDDDVLDDHALSLGAIATNGKFEGSYLQFGYGPTDVFAVDPDDRWKVDALLSVAPDGWGPISFFAEITVNVDGGRGADSIQSYFGFDLNLGEVDELWGGGS